ncbi:hypothetical protein MUN89_12340 [Halobacillus salinarum]|uniref:15-methylpalmitoyl-4-hydroxy-2-pyrone 4-O-methyltransferase n=1 Tax=Halobacillus salinarum TaxID=2932257 RepID=A0ABY4EE68_9BACI|nr:isoprenylcysteine carboxylmethyltransferase family protein [Halobacillus salinarum]UOQ42756.1 hypothetical protein MUN89_12340 [Halobacillus salinarum]
MNRVLIFLYVFIIIERIGELYIARSNRKWMLDRGAVETGDKHYLLFILLHVLFFLSIAAEFIIISPGISSFFLPAFLLFLILQVLRVWCMASLGRRWNTRIIVLPEEAPLARGIYKYMDHPNYVIVFLELLVIPVMFQAYVTAVIFPLLHLLLVVYIRIPQEDTALNRRH